jgi:biotin carboxylase
MANNSVRIGIIHAYPNSYLIKSLQKLNYLLVLFVPQKPTFDYGAIESVEAVVEVPFYEPSAVVEQIIAYHQKRPFDALLPVYEGATIMTAQAAVALELQGVTVEAAQESRNKYLAYQQWFEQGIPVPLTIPLSEIQSGWQMIESHIGYPAIIKLTDSMNSQGVIKVTSHDSYQEAVNRLLKMLSRPVDVDLQTDRNRLAYGTSEVQIIAQEYCSGIEVGVDCLVTQGNCQILGIFEKAPATGPYFAESMSISPASLSPEQIESVSKIATDAALTLISDRSSAAHVEIRLTEQGFKVLEAGLRPGGAYTVAAIEYLTGINLYRELVQVLLEKERSHILLQEKAALYGGIIITHNGTLKKIQGLEIFEQISELLDVQILNKPGDRVYALPESAQPHFAYYLIGGESREEVLEKHHLIQESIHLEISESENS